jgi:hypothetical protein
LILGLGLAASTRQNHSLTWVKNKLANLRSRSFEN